MRRRTNKERTDFEDDGRTIANMNIDGMPGYNPSLDRKSDENSDEIKGKNAATGNEKISLTKSEERSLLFGVMSATLLVGLIFALVFLAFILFCMFIWFK